MRNLSPDIYEMLMKRFSFFFISILVCINALSQFTIGTTGLLNMPTAVMQQDKTFMFGGGFWRNMLLLLDGLIILIIIILISLFFMVGSSL